MPRDKNGRFISKQQAAQQEQGQPVNDCGSGSLAVGDQSQLGASGAISFAGAEGNRTQGCSYHSPRCVP